jgi:hypothetical protein
MRIKQYNTDWEAHKQSIYEKYLCYGERRAREFVDYYAKLYDEHKKPFLNHRIAWHLFDDMKLVQKSGVIWYAVIGNGGTGKTTLSMNCLHFVDPTFNLNRVSFSAYDFVNILNSFPVVNAMKGVQLDEPDNSIHTTSTQGKLLRSILGKARQQKIFAFYCATDMNDVPGYIYNKLSRIIFTNCLGSAVLFKDRPKKAIYVMSAIKEAYRKWQENAFYNHKRKGMFRPGGLQFGTYGHLPFNKEEVEKYEEEKRNDYKNTLENFVKAHDKKGDIKSETQIRNEHIKKMYDNDVSVNKLSEIYNLTVRSVYRAIKNVPDK